MTRETAPTRELSLATDGGGGSWWWQSRRRGSFPSAERGTIFARWFAVGETGGRVQVDVACGLVGVRAPPLPHALSRPPTIFLLYPPRARARGRIRTRRVASLVLARRVSSCVALFSSRTDSRRRHSPTCLSSSNGASAVSVGKRDNKIWWVACGALAFSPCILPSPSLHDESGSLPSFPLSVFRLSLVRATARIARPRSWRPTVVAFFPLRSRLSFVWRGWVEWDGRGTRPAEMLPRSDM